MSKKWINTTAKDVVSISGSIWNDDTRTVANAVNYNAQILKDALNRIAELEKTIKPQESEKRMTKEEALAFAQKELQAAYKRADKIGIKGKTKYIEVLEMVVKVLEQELSRDMEEIAEAIKSDVDAETKCKMISNILTAKPHYFEISQESQEPCEDVISREYAIRTLRADTLFVCTGDKMQAISDIEGLPPATQETAEWIKMPIGFKCSNCNELEDRTTKFCPNCGKKMIKSQEI